jgi:hypothetical protein
VRAHSLLVVPLPTLTAVVPPLEEVEPAPHVVLVEPFTGPSNGLAEIGPGVVTELTAFFADVLPFTVRATRTAQVWNGTTYLTLDQSAAFRRLRHELLRHFPELPGSTQPLAGSFPFLAVPSSAEASTAVRTLLEPHLPVTVHAAEAALWWRDGTHVRSLERFPFARTAA